MRKRRAAADRTRVLCGTPGRHHQALASRTLTGRRDPTHGGGLHAAHEENDENHCGTRTAMSYIDVDTEGRREHTVPGLPRIPGTMCANVCAD